jgi:hypothetical protein
MKSQPKFREVKVPAPAFTLVVTPYYGSEPGLSVHVTASMSFIEGMLARVIAQTESKKEGT